MKQDLELQGESGVLMPSIPWDAGVKAQQKRIFDAMAKSGAEKTFSATTIADIVGYASISRATFYKHFTNKRECFQATVMAFLEELESLGRERHAACEGTQPDAVREVVTILVEHLEARPDHAKLLLLEATVVDHEIVKRYRNLVLEALERLQESFELDDSAAPDPEAAFGSAMVLVAGHLGAGQGSQLSVLTPELVYLTLRPYAGAKVALAQAQLAR
jgi:AcrR family transcriptional regulator